MHSFPRSHFLTCTRHPPLQPTGTRPRASFLSIHMASDGSTVTLRLIPFVRYLLLLPFVKPRYRPSRATFPPMTLHHRFSLSLGMHPYLGMSHQYFVILLIIRFSIFYRTAIRNGTHRRAHGQQKHARFLAPRFLAVDQGRQTAPLAPHPGLVVGREAAEANAACAHGRDGDALVWQRW